MSNNDVEVDPEKKNAVQHMKDPHNIKKLRAVLGLTHWILPKFIEGFEKNSENTLQTSS